MFRFRLFFPLLFGSLAITLLSAADEQREHERKCDEALADFSFSDSYGGVDNAIEGRWFLHFQENGTIQMGFWGALGKKPAYQFDTRREFTVELDDVFQSKSRWKRVDDTTLVIRTGSMKYTFDIAPNYEAGDPAKSALRLTFTERGKNREFEIGFWPEYESKFQASTEIR